MPHILTQSCSISSMGCWVWPERMSWFSWLPVKQAQNYPTPYHTVYSKHKSCFHIKKAAFNGQLCVQQVCLNGCGTFNDIFNSLFPAFYAAFLCQVLTVKGIIMKILFSFVNQVKDKQRNLTKESMSAILTAADVSLLFPQQTTEWVKACTLTTNY